MEHGDSTPESTPSNGDAPDAVKNRLAWMFVLLVLPNLCCGGGGKAVPGGPFISIFSDIIPCLCALIAIQLGLWNLRIRGLLQRLATLILMGLFTLVISKVLIGVILFWNRPMARGDLFGL